MYVFLCNFSYAYALHKQIATNMVDLGWTWLGHRPRLRIARQTISAKIIDNFGQSSLLRTSTISFVHSHTFNSIIGYRMTRVLTTWSKVAETQAKFCTILLLTIVNESFRKWWKVVDSDKKFLML